MQNRQSLAFAMAAVLVLPVVLLARMPGVQSGGASSKAAARFDPHDLSGTWDFDSKIPGQGVHGAPSKEHPPFAPWAQARFDAAKPGYGPRAQPGGNDPILRCDPSGIPRILFSPQPYQIVQLPDRTFMFFESEHEWRQIWTDGRDHPKDLVPNWMGDSIGRWDGNTFVVDTVGFNDKSWLDSYGDPHSKELHVVERYKRVNHNTLTLQLVVDDPKAYASPWVGDTSKSSSCLTGERR